MDLIHAPAQPAALAPMSPDEARRAMETYREMCQSLLTSDDMQRVGDRDFTKRSGFQKLAAAYGVSTEIKSLEVERHDDGSILRARAIVHATHPSGRYAEGDGACSVDEKRFRRGAEKIEHDLPATAVTRATNRAVSNLVAFGTVSAEEAEAGASPGGVSPSTPAWAAPVSDVGGVAQALNNLFEQVGVSESAQATAAVGQLIFDDCDQGIPICVARTVNHIADVIRDSGPQEATLAPDDDAAKTVDEQLGKDNDNEETAA